MAQNIYDDDGFFAGYSQLERSVSGLDGAPEWPVLRSMLPPIAGRDVVDLGCGFGWFCRWAEAQGAASVLGFDLSEKMLARARAETAAPTVTYRRADLGELCLPPGGFDLAYSSLALHYLEDAGRLFREVYRALRPSGRFVFSTEHPVFMAPARPAWSRDGNDKPVWPLSGYSDEGRRVTDWLANGVEKYHRTLATTLNLLISAGFRVDRVEEFCPTAEQVAARPALAIERERPMFLLVAVSR